ncbi:family 20 glycosylhydrolase [Psychrobium sp. 1_MG-2023]|uniref:family 20 glycosylhydrolase n=1 Tax=Psychrobium sp. 1_MG-2023 TaxID=3062624 RepID=UPI000C343322|nr:family 20 glycosylhydrolase [Psychrobium sp. 1_MG-2023]MDP2560039.1 family 20 glycosylhydrolase [Psychrobium sp. 1_MG-2023]PKF56299.1 beta-N-acetylhexosaminidase [Alteromonadales bacterium alter-6D02]
MAAIKKLLCSFALINLAACSAPQGNDTQQSLDKFAQSLQVKYNLDHAFSKECGDSDKKSCLRSTINLSLPYDYSEQRWEIFFSSLSPVIAVDSDQFMVKHINGDLHQIVPTLNFQGFKAGSDYSVTIFNSGSQITRSEFMPNYIVKIADSQPRVIESTKTIIDDETGLELQPYLAPFTSIEKQFKLNDKDLTSWASSQSLYQTQPAATEVDVSASLLPQPAQVQTLSHESLSLAKGLKFELNNIAREELATAIERLELLGVQESVTGHTVAVNVDSNFKAEEQGYQLVINQHGITVKAADNAGAYYGLMSLAGLITLGDDNLASVKIDDQPRYAFRGVHVDVARNFHSKQFLIDLIKQMGAYKLNKLHLHLADDEGWRLAIPGLEQLTDLGAYRCLDLSETKCLLPQLGSGLESDSAVNGYLSREDYIDLLHVAKAHHIQVIPSLDMPGHSRAAIKSMDLRYRQLMAQGKPKQAKEFWLTEPEDTTVYSSIQYYNDNTLNVCMDSTYRFVDKVVTEIQKMHRDAGQELVLYHIGADETAGAWTDSPSCQALEATGAIDMSRKHAYNGYFIERVSAMLAEKDIVVAGWSDGMGHTDATKMPQEVQSNSWSTLYFDGHVETHRQANQDWDIVMSSPDVTYFDFPYEAHPQERGNHWASREISTRKVFEFMPDNLPAHAEIWHNLDNRPYKADDTQSQLKQGINFAGIQGHLWSEMIRSDNQAEYMLFPRLLALAERAWHRAAWEVDYQRQGAVYSKDSNFFTEQAKIQREKDWQRFANVLAKKELAKLEAADIFYRIPTVAASIVDGKLTARTLLPGLAIEYKTQQGKWTLYESPVTITGEVAVRSMATDGQRKGRTLTVMP